MLNKSWPKWILGCAALAGCAAGSAPSEIRPTVQGVVVTTADGTRFEGAPVRVDVSEGADIPAQVSITARAPDGRVWNAMFGLPSTNLAQGSVSLLRRPPAYGIGMVGLDNGGDAPEDFDSGTLTFSLAGGVVEGQATTQPVHGSASFRGRYQLRCMVYPQTLGQMVSGEGPGEVRVRDTALASAFCRQFANLR